MSALQARGRVVYHVIGRPEHIANVMATQDAAGRLVGARAVRRLPDGRVEVALTLLERPRGRRAAARPPWYRRPRTALLVALGAVGGLALAFWAFSVLMDWVVATVATHLDYVLGAALAVLGILALASRVIGTRCPGLHCDGCAHR